MNRPADAHGDWVLWRPDGYGSRAPLYVPPDLARRLEAEHRQRELERLSAEKADVEKRRRAGDEESATDAARTEETTRPQAASIGEHRTHPFEVHRHAVLRDVERIAERVEQLRAGLYGDKDHTSREVKALTSALERGPDRSVVRPPEWRQALDDLAVEMPAFRAAVEVVAHALALSEATHAPPAIPPLLLLGPPGVGKSYFCRRLADVLESRSAWLAMDQPTAGCTLRGTDAHWSTARHGVLFERLALGDTANPVIVIDEIDKATRRQGSQDVDMLAQLYSALEPETSQRITDVSLDVDLDASQVVYVASTNGLRNLDAALLSRFEVVQVGLPSPEERRDSARRVVESTLARLGVRGVVRVSSGSFALLAEYTPRVIKRAVERAVGAAVATGRDRLSADDFEVALGLAPGRERREMRTH
jgi:ATP-dependent Lon protease